MGPELAGGIFDATGSYHLAFIGCAIAALFAALLDLAHQRYL